MNRTRAEALVLVNWNGVFYERYLFHRHVTALEGANAAGKTTVMIAAYVVLMPDMSRLRFTNLGETGATGGDKGIWGRLGESGRPSYTAIDFRVAGDRRLVAGVHLERKGEPSVEPTPFLVTGLADDIRLQDLMLVLQGDSEAVPELQELRENAARLGGRLQVFSSARDYFAALFEAGVTPLRLGTDEERNKLNDMLRTSMTGGISRALTSELRGFLLKEEGSLADTLQRMKANLDACRRTRTEVQESRVLEQEIGNVFSAGHAMFTAAFLATRERADELDRRVADAELARATAIEAEAAAQDAFAASVAELAAVEAQREEVVAALEAARQRSQRMHDALAAAAAVTERARALEIATEETARLAADRASAEQARTVRRDALRRAQENYKRAAMGLADLQRGIEELHHRAGAYQQAVRRLREAEAALGGTIAMAEIDDRLASTRGELDRVDEQRAECATSLADADLYRRRHAKVLAALSSLVDHPVDPTTASEIAIEALREHRERRALAERLPTIAAQLGEARGLAARQARARSRVAELDVQLTDEPAATTIGLRLDEADAARARHESAERSARADLPNVERAQQDLDRQRKELVAREPVWREHAARAVRLGEHLGFEVADRTGLDQARARLDEQLRAARTAEQAIRECQEQLIHDARELSAAGGPVQPELLHLRDRLGADLVSGIFEDVAVEEAGVLEARLGSLAHALVVDEPRAAAEAARDRPAALNEVLFVARDADIEKLASGGLPHESSGADVVVPEGAALRVSRIPEHPRLGRRAREARATELRTAAEAKARELEDARAHRRLLERHVRDGEELLAGHAIWLAGDPTRELTETRRKLDEGTAQLEALRSAVKEHAAAARTLRPRIDGLRGCLAEAFLLDPPDYAHRVIALEREHESAVAARTAADRADGFAETVANDAAVLRRLPLSDDDLLGLRRRLDALRAERTRLDTAIEGLAYVQSHVEALGWSEASARLEAEHALVPALKAQLDEAETEQEESEHAAMQADTAYNETTERWQDADGRRRVAIQQHAAAVEEFDALGIAAPTQGQLLEAQSDVARTERELRARNDRRDELIDARGRQQSVCERTRERTKEADEKLTSERREAEPARTRWQRLHELALKHGLHASSPGAEDNELGGVRGHVNLVQAANTQRTVLLERLRAARGSSALLAELEMLRDSSDADFGDAILDLWLAVREWLRRRLPAQVAEVADPREALLRLRDQLSSLEERLSRQEGDLRGASEDVARGIDVQIRKARGQVNRLNRNLDGVSFGNIEGIRVKLQPVERMEQVLRALREGAAQGLLFQENLPIEDALDEIFRRYAGGRTGGQRLLDYREYVHLQVEIRRKSGPEWEIANPTRLSTGEAIGVGAALMMVVLTEWERDATLLRGKKSQGSLRFLFLDEANRLSYDNLGVLFELCRTLDLQLLIAAPEVAHAEGNWTYRLVRHTGPDGRAQVIVTGRRTRAEA